MNNDMILKIKTPPQWDNISFIENISNQRPVSFAQCQVAMVNDIFSDFSNEIKTAIVSQGLSNLLRRQILSESLVAKGAVKTFIESLMINFLKDVISDSELIILDPYFFAATRNPDYVNLVLSIIQPFITSLASIRILTLPDKISPTISASIQSGLRQQNPSISIFHKTTDEYHDRFWISSNRTKGIITGSSLNGLGRRYAIIDKLSSDDVKDIVMSLTSNNLL